MATNPPSFGASHIEQWRKLAEQNTEMWLANADPTVKQTAQQFLASQKVMFSFWEMAEKAWGTMLTQVNAGQNWQAALTDYMATLREQIPNSAELLQSNNDLWQLYMEQWQQFMQPWMAAAQQNPLAFGANGSSMIELSKLYQTAYNQTFGKLLDAPGIGQNRELNEKFIAGFKAWQELQRANIDYQLILANTGVKAFESFLKAAVSKAQAGQPITTIKQLTDVWTEVADPIFIDIFKSDSYVKIQGALLSAFMNYRIQSRRIMEKVFSEMDIPTRSEVDEAHRNIYNQKKEIKALKKALAAGKPTAASGGESKKIAALEKTVATLKSELTALKKENNLAELKAELETLKKAMAEAAAPKPAPRKRTTTRKRTTKTEAAGGETNDATH